MKYNKLEISYFYRVYNNSSLELDLLFVKKHVCYYSIKILSTVKAMSMLGNLNRDILLLQKYCLYIILITTYNFLL